MVLIIAPTTMQTIEYFGFPSARIKLLIPFVTMRNGIPINVMLTQQQIQRIYELERQMMKRFAQKGPRKGMGKGKNGKPGAGNF